MLGFLDTMSLSSASTKSLSWPAPSNLFTSPSLAPSLADFLPWIKVHTLKYILKKIIHNKIVQVLCISNLHVLLMSTWVSSGSFSSLPQSKNVQSGYLETPNKLLFVCLCACLCVCTSALRWTGVTSRHFLCALRPLKSWHRLQHQPPMTPKID